MFQWIRSIPYFTSLLLDDQVLLLKTGWNELIISEFSYRSIRTHNSLVLANGVSISKQDVIVAGIGDIFERVLHELVAKMREMNMDKSELSCLRAIVLFNPGKINPFFPETSKQTKQWSVLAIENLKNPMLVERLRDRIYTLLENHCWAWCQDKTSRFAKLLVRLPALRSIGLKCVEHLFFKKFLMESNQKETIGLYLVTNTFP